MNCKPGDLAVIVKSHYGNEGRFVEVIDGDYQRCDGWWGVEGMGVLWRVRPQTRLNSSWGTIAREIAVPDAWLRPIRPGDISDEEVRDLYAPKVPEAA